MVSESVKAETTLVPPFPTDGIYPVWYERKIIKMKNIVCNRLYPVSPMVFIITNAVVFSLYSKYRLNEMFTWLPKPTLELLSVMKTVMVRHHC
ncbi:hypothetical protein AB6A40_009005 [Gnathostoma spinigerum]|uniref:Uncharacterized protein n=1 Tax=Gnathostoma spinigerum TaxID=75299 RepID=A0ABD6ER19_9BILA